MSVLDSLPHGRFIPPVLGAEHLGMSTDDEKKRQRRRTRVEWHEDLVQHVVGSQGKWVHVKHPVRKAKSWNT